MRYQPERHHRHSARIKGYDYSQPGPYFITLCAHNRDCWFGMVIDGTVQLSPMGKAAYDCWLQIPYHFRNAALDEFVVMPNHLHGIVNIADVGVRNIAVNVGVQNFEPLQGEPPHRQHRFQQTIPRSIGSIVRTYKSAVTLWCRRNGFDHFQWQRNYYEHIIRSEIDLNKIRRYIVDNPRKWDEDEENPARN